MANDQQTVYHSAAQAPTTTYPRITDPWDLMTYNRYPEPEAVARIAYDEACMATEAERARLDKDLDDLLYYQKHQPACVKTQWDVVRLDHQAIARCEAAEAAAWHELQRVRDDLRAGRI